MAIYKTVMPLILASGSPRRKELLSGLGLNFVCKTAEIIEPKPESSETPEIYATRMASLKADATLSAVKEANNTSDKPTAILAADTIVVLNGRILGKPTSHKHAFEMLSELSGQTHCVYTACALRLTTGISQNIVVRSEVQIAQLESDVLRLYAASEEPMDKAGAYAVQGVGAFMVQSICGSWSNVVGLPLYETINLLIEANVINAVKIQ